MTHYKEKDLEAFIEEYLLSHFYIKREDRDYDKSLCLDSELLYSFILSTQSKALDELSRRGIKDTKETLLKRIASSIREKGILKSLQGYVEVSGVKFTLAYPKPSTDSNPTALQNYSSNTLSLIRQLHYGSRNNNSLDMVLFLNGIPLITIELKNPFTGQNVYHAIEQYKRDRDPSEPLFERCIVHFALDSDLVYMTTKLHGVKTFFLPFNRGLNNGSGAIGCKSGAGNPPSEGIKTAYLWERIFSKDTLIPLVLEFVQEVDGKIIFPRYHQFDVVEKLLEDVRERGVGGRYLIQHSAGSGKSNSISWLSHALVGLHRERENGELELVFDSVIVVTDRRVLDAQIRENIKKFSHIKGIVEAITDGSRHLREALEEGKKIIISTIQKFPHILDEMLQVKGKRFAIIIDEAHSSQSGTSAQKLGEVIRDREESSEDKIIEIIKNKKLQPNASYFAFTATPKPKTLEMFGTPYEIDGVQKFIPFHLYSMKQAIEEGFIHDVLRGYTTYNSYYKIASSVEDNPMFDKKKANAKIKRYVESDENAIAKKAEIMIDHFYANIHKRIAGKAKAMVVTSSRENAVKYFFAFREYLKSKFPSYGVLVAFSGEVVINGESYSESGLNGISEARLKEEFEKDKYRFLIVAEKYQTGFDQPLLHTMYVDKRLSGVSAAQTLSRLNRTCKNKEDTCVLDFANTHEEIGESFSTFYEQTFLGEPTDINKIFDLKSNLFEYEVFYQEEVDEFAEMILRRERENAIHAKLDVMVARYEALGSDDIRLEFYNKAKTYLKDYSFLAQILPFEDIELEKTYILLKKLIAKLLPPRAEDLAKGILDSVDFESYRVQLDKTLDITLEGEGELKPSQADGTSRMPEAELEGLMEIIREFNEKHGVEDWGEEDKLAKGLIYVQKQVEANQQLLKNAQNSDKQNAQIVFADVLAESMQTILDTHFFLYQQFNDNKEFKERITRKMFDMWYDKIGAIKGNSNDLL
ncbi:type I restriction endonuclease [uncultured Helicobacter sp.]|uniref:type I restriction endonuclease subunit R n=1 Tax=uncultured Helicobacter sp. TaxID=175537 RepID=UPI0026202269|nr:type I restriction endonuclease [uncultured Helicobacter sp.]